MLNCAIERGRFTLPQMAEPANFRGATRGPCGADHNEATAFGDEAEEVRLKHSRAEDRADTLAVVANVEGE
jgi:hypothetical protein